MQGRVKLSKAAELLGVCYKTAQRMAYSGRMPTVRSDTGRIFVPLGWLQKQIGGVEKPSDTAENV
jgi:predicted site-specific integrase-resolvase